MRVLIVAAISSLAFAGGVHAADVDPLVPVKTIMTIVEQNTKADSGGRSADYLSGDLLHENFSSSFVKLIEHSRKKAEADEEPFVDYDPVIGGQDSCPLKDVSITDRAKKNNTFEVIAKFKADYCFGADMRNDISETHFRVIVEDGKPLIDDIINIVQDSPPISLRNAVEYFVEQ